MSRGFVVDHKESGVRYAVSERNFNEKIHDMVRDLGPGETVQGYQPKRKESLGDSGSPTPTPEAAGDQAVSPGDSPEASSTSRKASKTEGSSAEGTQDTK